MAIKKSDLYSSLWASCDELRGGMDASQYKDYVLFMLFIKYVSDKYGDSEDFAPAVVIPKGAPINSHPNRSTKRSNQPMIQYSQVRRPSHRRETFTPVKVSRQSHKGLPRERRRRPLRTAIYR